jgi:hypothetical protein
MNSAPWRNPKVLSTLLFVFLSGAVVGAVGMRLAAPQSRQAKTLSYWREGGKEISIQRFKKELNLTDEQASEVGTVLDDFVMYYQTLQAQMDDVRATGKNRILRLLNDDQKQKFEKMMNEFQQKPLR